MKNINLVLNTKNSRTNLWHCLDGNESYEKELDKDLTARFASTFEFCNSEINNL